MHPIDQSLDIIIPERLRARHWEGFSATMQTGRSRYGEGRAIMRDTTTRFEEPRSLRRQLASLAPKPEP